MNEKAEEFTGLSKSKDNPFMLDSGREPVTLVQRKKEKEEIFDTFSAEVPVFQSCFITGIQGSGKTVILTSIAKHFIEQDKWVVIELNPEKDMLQLLAAKLNEQKALKLLFSSAKLNLSFFGIGAEIEGVEPIREIGVVVEKMLMSMKKDGKKLLIIVDDITPSVNLRSFICDYLIYIRQGLPAYFIMTGLYEQIQELQNEKHMTSLARIPKIHLKPLSISLMAEQYSKVFDIEQKQAFDMAKLTKGYSFAFQILGYLTWKYGNDPSRIITEYKQYLGEYVYERLWDDLSNSAKDFLYAVAKCPDGGIDNIRNAMKNPNAFISCRASMIKKGIIDSQSKGYLQFALPFFDEYVLENCVYMEI